MAKRSTACFYLRLAWNNIWRSRRVYVPQMLAIAVISAAFLLITGLLHSETLKSMPAGQTASMIFSLGMVVFAIFAFCFMVYINNFLIAQRRKEFGLYGILGLEKRHVARVLVWENLFVTGMGVLAGTVIALVFGRLLFLLLVKLIREINMGTFSIAPRAYVLTYGLFFLIFVFTSLLNLRQVRLSSPIELMHSAQKGEKETRLNWPLTILGVIALGVAYYFAWTIENPGIALGVFFLLAILVIFGTFALFTAGSIVVLHLLKKNKAYYYQARHFVTISGLIQRMKQNARSLSMICILSTMLVVTVSGTCSLYLGQGEMNELLYPYDVEVYVPEDATQAEIERFAAMLPELAKANNVTLSADEGEIITLSEWEKLGEQYARDNVVADGWQVTRMGPALRTDDALVFDADGDYRDCLAFVKDLHTLYEDSFRNQPRLWMSDRYTARQDGYGLYGGLLFLGVFFGLLFLAVAVLIIYFKQITEGYEDRERFAILQKVGMDDTQVRKTIDKQVLWVFFLPLGTTMLHMVFASRMIARMLQTFMLYDWGLVLACIGGACLLFAVLYLIVYRLTAKVYYKIVRR